MILRWLVLLVALLGSGCQEPYSGPGRDSAMRPGQLEATILVWETYRELAGDREPPTVYFVTGDALDCAGGIGYRGWGQICVGGETIHELGPAVWLAWPMGAKFSNELGFSHEFLHAAIGKGDPDHQHPGWAKGGLHDQAVEALKDAGL